MYGEVYNASSSDPRHIVLDQTVSKWELVNLNTNQSIVADASIGSGNQQLFSEYGFAVEVNQENPPAWDYVSNSANFDESNRLISSSIEFENEYNPWLGGVRDVDEEDGETSVTNTYLWGRNWIHAGSYISAANAVFNDIDGLRGIKIIDSCPSFLHKFWSHMSPMVPTVGSLRYLPK